MRYLLAGLLVMWAVAPTATRTNNIEYLRRASGAIRLDASVPTGVGPFPTVIIVHGGGFERGNKAMYVPPVFDPLTRAGFEWFSIDYRLAPNAKVQDQVDDVQSALDWVYAHAEQYHVDKKRIALLGESAGAYLVDYVAATAPKSTPIAAVVSFYGPSDLTRQFRDKPVPEVLQSFFGVGGTTELSEERLRLVAPRYMVHAGMPPFLLLHGTADEQVPYEQSPDFCAALKREGNSCELVTVPGARHGIGQWEQHANQQAYKGKIVDWLKAELQP